MVRPSDKDELTDRVFRAVMDRLSTRSRKTLLTNGVRDSESFLSLTYDTIAGFQNAGIKTIAEILTLQACLEPVIRGRTEGQPPTDESVRREIAETPIPAAFDTSGSPPKARRALRHLSYIIHSRPTTVTRSLDDPAEWSILRATLPDVFRVPQDMMPVLWDSFSDKPLSILGLPEDEWKRVAGKAVYPEDSLEMILAGSIGYLLTVFSGSAFDRLLARFGDLAGEYAEAPSVNAAVDRPVVTEDEIRTVRNFSLDSFETSPAARQMSELLGLHTWRDLAAVSEKSILESTGIRRRAFELIRELWRMKVYAAKAAARSSDTSFASLESMVQAFVAVTARTSRERTILLGRMGLLEDRDWTLKELGNMLGLTRERVRQIERRMVRVLRSPDSGAHMGRFRLAADEIIRQAGGVCSLQEMGNRVTDRLEWDHLPPQHTLMSVVRLLKRFSVDKTHALVVDRNHRCRDCPRAVTALAEMFEEDRSERSLQEVTEQLLAFCATVYECSELSRSYRFSETFIRSAAAQTKHVVIDHGVVYHGDTWGAKLGSRRQLAESIVKAAGRPMHYTEVCEKARSLYPDDVTITDARVHDWIMDSCNLLQWDRGTCIHRDQVRVPPELLTLIARSLRRRLRNGQTAVTVVRPFSVYRARLTDAGVTSKTALYSCLRMLGHRSLVFPRYPRVVLKHPRKKP